jgi:hypothetical protein
MPITAKLSRKFYEKFGDDLTNELVNWLNQVDATYRSDLRELNELNFARFDASMGQRLAELRSEMVTRFAQADAKLEQRVVQLEAKLEAKLEQRTGELDAKWDQRFTRLEAKLDTLKADLSAGMAGAETRIIRWTFLFFAASLGTLVALMRL